MKTSDAKEIIRIFDEMEEKRTYRGNWYGIPEIKFYFYNTQSDPEIEYKGKRCSCYIIEDTMWERFNEDGFSDSTEFEKYMIENKDTVYELCELALFGE